MILDTAIAACHCLNILLTGAVEANDLAQGALWRFTQCRWIGHKTFQLWRGHSTTELSSPIPRYKVMSWSDGGPLPGTPERR